MSNRPFGRRRTWRRRWTAGRAGKGSSNLRDHQVSSDDMSDLLQLSAALCTWKVVVDLQVAGLVAAGCKQQAPGFYS